jgi:hypothetical protein
MFGSEDHVPVGRADDEPTGAEAQTDIAVRVGDVMEVLLGEEEKVAAGEHVGPEDEEPASVSGILQRCGGPVGIGGEGAFELVDARPRIVEGVVGIAGATGAVESVKLA